jgi:hypothetical protein
MHTPGQVDTLLKFQGLQQVTSIPSDQTLGSRGAIHMQNVRVTN